jgi:nucleoside 2-deoxyribosyltransferase
MLKVYIACPYSKGDIEKNVYESMRITNELINNGFIPFNPLYSHFQHINFHQPYEKWLELDLEWLKVCDCVLRIPGESNGADKEVKVANKLSIPVFYSLEEVLNYREENIRKGNLIGNFLKEFFFGKETSNINCPCPGCSSEL